MLFFIPGCITVALVAIWALLGKIRYADEVLFLQRKVSEYEQRLQYKCEISNEIAHDIKNPLTAILCSAEALELILGPKVEPEYQKTIHYIREYGEQMLRLISDFLDINLSESGRLQAHPEAIDVKDAVESVTVLLKSTAERKQVRIEVSNVLTSASVYFDSKHIKQILFNLVHNAIKFTQKGGSVRVSASLVRDFDSVCIGISDTGVGIDESILPHLFDPFSHEARSLNESEKGTSLGLALCRNLVELGGGSIQVRSTKGRGTTFEIFLPLAVAEVQTPTTILIPNEKPLAGHSVLLFDEDRGARDSMALLIQALGGIVDTASQVEDALSALMKNEYTAVMIDSKTDGGAGYALAKLIKDDLHAKETRIILAGDLNMDTVLATEFGVDICVNKPLNGKRLVESLG